MHKTQVAIIILSLTLISPTFTFGIDSAVDNTETAEASKSLEHIVSLFTYMGRPLNNNNERIIMLVNHGYAIGYSKSLKQPLWACYRYSKVSTDRRFERPPLFYVDTRLPKEDRLSTATFGGGYHRGHMAPNYGINTQYGKLAQLETFLMSNICPQKGDLNSGIWKKIEHDMIDRYAKKNRQVFVICGPVFRDDHGHVKGIIVPSHFYKIIVDFEHHTQGRKKGQNKYPPKPIIMALLFSQDTPKNSTILDAHFSSVDEIESLTGLNFFPEFSKNRQKKYESKKTSLLPVYGE